MNMYSQMQQPVPQYYSGYGYGYGANPPATTPPPASPQPSTTGNETALEKYVAFKKTPLGVASTVAHWVAVPVLAYHGYKRNNSVGWALVWGIFGGMVWPLAGAIAVAEGFGQPAKKS